MVTVLQKAARLPDGRVPGVPPPRLEKRVVRQLTVQQHVRYQEIRLRGLELQKQMRKLLEDLGLDPRELYKFWPNGEVTEVGKHTPRY